MTADEEAAMIRERGRLLSLHKRYATRARHTVAVAEAAAWAQFKGATSDVARVARDNALERAAHAGDRWAALADSARQQIDALPS